MREYSKREALNKLKEEVIKSFKNHINTYFDTHTFFERNKTFIISIISLVISLISIVVAIYSLFKGIKT